MRVLMIASESVPFAKTGGLADVVGALPRALANLGHRVDVAPDPSRRMLELMRLVRALHKRGLAAQVGARGCAAGFSAYCGGDRALRRALLAHLPRELRRLARHAWAYR
jgi:hypothetical protein